MINGELQFCSEISVIPSLRKSWLGRTPGLAPSASTELSLVLLLQNTFPGWRCSTRHKLESEESCHKLFPPHTGSAASSQPSFLQVLFLQQEPETTEPWEQKEEAQGQRGKMHCEPFSCLAVGLKGGLDQRTWRCRSC